MTGSAASVLGGFGLFLLGMVVLTDGLRGVTGETLQRALARFTRSPVSGALTGATTTAIVQSSSATTVAAVGFVGAGLLSFPQALGIVFGANVGTTVTGWLVALVGFKLELGTALLPLVLPGVLMRLFGRGRTAAAGYALCGFGLIFFGISLLRGGMAGLEGTITPETLPSGGLLARLALVGIGVAITLVTQSSSAGVAVALTAVDAGTIDLAQAAAMVIGMDVGTTATAAAATIGGSVSARRTGYAHVLYNLMTGFGAFLLVGPYVSIWTDWAGGSGSENAELALVGFHTLFNTLGLMVLLPFAHAFASLMVRLVPEKGPLLTSRLDDTLLDEPSAAIGGVAATVRDLADHALAAIAASLTQRLSRTEMTDRLAPIVEGVTALRSYLDRMRIPTEAGRTVLRHLSGLHALDHVERLLDRCEELDRAQVARSVAELATPCAELRDSVHRARTALADREIESATALPRSVWRDIDELGETYRRGVMKQVGEGALTFEQGIDRLEALRWLRRVAYHTWRIVHHVRRAHFEADLEEPEEAPPATEATLPE